MWVFLFFGVGTGNWSKLPKYLLLTFQVTASIVQIFIPTTELAITAVIQTKEAKTEIETHPVNVEAKMSKFSI